MSFLKKFFTKEKQEPNSKEAFWEWFTSNEKKFRKAVRDQSNVHEIFINPLSAKLNLMREGFTLLIGMIGDDKVEMIISVDGVLKNIVFAEELIACAPSNEHWEFRALKPAIDVANFNLAIGGTNFTEENLFFNPIEETDYPDEIVIEVIHLEHKSEVSHLLIHGAITFLDNYLGELFFTTSIDNFKLSGKENFSEDAIPISKLKNYIIWRQKEIDESTTNHNYQSDSTNFSVLEGSTENGKPLFAHVNLELLDYEYKTSYPYTLILEIKYDRDPFGLPLKADKDKFDEFELLISTALDNSKNYLKFGRQTANGSLFIFFLCKEFRVCSKRVDEIKRAHKFKVTSSYNIYKDKYWRTLEGFRAKPEETEF